MSSRIYTDIIINEGQFSIVERQNKLQAERSALTTLNRIEKVMRNGLKYSTTANDSYSKMSGTELREQLKLKAQSIRDGYLNKSQPISQVRRFFKDISKKEKNIGSVCERIENLAGPSPILDLPNELIQHICGFLQAGDLGKLAQLNEHANTHAKQAEVQRAREYGYRGHDLAEARNDLKKLFRVTDTLAKDRFIPEKHVVRHGRWPFWRYVDSEATFKRIKYLSESQENDLKVKLDEALLYYSENGNSAVAFTLLHLGANLEVRDNDGHTPLALAAVEGHKDVIEQLIRADADVNTQNNCGSTPLILTIYYAQSEVISHLLLDNGAVTTIDHPNDSGYSALHVAAEKGQVSIVEMLLRLGANFEVRDNDGYTPLALAAKKGQVNCVGQLIRAGADVNTQNNRRSTPLILTIYYAQSEVISRLLLDNGAVTTIDHISITGYNALHIAAEKEHASIVELLVQRGADKSLLNGQGQTAIQLTNNNRIRKLLQDV